MEDLEAPLRLPLPDVVVGHLPLVSPPVIVAAEGLAVEQPLLDAEVEEVFEHLWPVVRPRIRESDHVTSSPGS